MAREAAAMLCGFLGRVASNPFIYDVIQRLAGAKEVHRRLSLHIDTGLHGGRILDVGGGTGTLRALWPMDCHYVCLDIEAPKLSGFRLKYPDGLALRANAAQMPVASGSMDVVVCVFVAHHLDDTTLTTVIRECRRVLKAGGRFIFQDPLHAPERRVSRLLWSLDRGAHPRSSKRLREYVERSFSVVHWETYTIYHQYVLCIGEPTSPPE